MPAVAVRPHKRQDCPEMRQTLTVDDEAHLLLRTLSVDYAAGCREARHVHSWPQFLYARTGAVRAVIGDAVWMTPPGRGLWIPAGAPHELTMLGATELRTLYCGPSIAAAVETASVRVVSGLLHEAILRACRMGSLDARDTDQRRLCALIAAEIATAEPLPLVLRLPRDPRARRLADLFLNAGDDEAGLARLCAETGQSRRTAERLFAAETGLPPARWRRLSRLSRAYALLLEGASVETATEAAGYLSRSAFTASFAEAFGVAPGAARAVRRSPGLLRVRP